MTLAFFRGKCPWPRFVCEYGGVVYRWSGWFGCQLESYEWRRVPAGTTREILREPMVVWSTAERRGLLVRTTWAMVRLRGTIDEQNAAIRNLEKRFRGEILV